MFDQTSLANNNWQIMGLVVLRISTGLLMTYHGLEIFDSGKMNEYAKWDALKSLPAPLLLTYIGKGLEFITGLLVTIGLFTRIAALLMAINMLIICFKIGNGKFYYEDQHPFIFALLSLVFFFTGPIKWSVDQAFSKQKIDQVL